MSVFRNKSSQRDGFAIDTLVGPDVVIRGDLEFSGGLYVEGRIVGKVMAAEGKAASLVLAEQGVIEGEVHAPVVIVNGTLTGDVHAGERVELAQKARVEGNVHYTVVEMSAGAQLTGRLVHTQPQTRALPAPEAGRERAAEPPRPAAVKVAAVAKA